jgi:hypothetical protein
MPVTEPAESSAGNGAGESRLITRTKAGGVGFFKIVGASAPGKL